VRSRRPADRKAVCHRKWYPGHSSVELQRGGRLPAQLGPDLYGRGRRDRLDGLDHLLVHDAFDLATRGRPRTLRRPEKGHLPLLTRCAVCLWCVAWQAALPPDGARSPLSDRPRKSEITELAPGMFFAARGRHVHVTTTSPREGASGAPGHRVDTADRRCRAVPAAESGRAMIRQAAQPSVASGAPAPSSLQS
jgi:hypothetical protein